MCGETTFKCQRQNVIPLIKKYYELQFGCKVGDQHKKLGPSYMLRNVCQASLAWVNGSHQMPFNVPTVWREPKDHSSECYLFCLTDITRITSKSKHTVKYPDLPSAMRHVPHTRELPVPKPPENLTFSVESSDSEEDHRQQGDNVECDLTFEASCSSSEPIYYQKEILTTYL